ncbi:MAG: succinylglutamate desuccinylase/aspartoacylase family protein [Clostridia bacterium]|nr:succinylglutamate desuccinylase/aspartoacylase family protein [Clostridia bacterium]
MGNWRIFGETIAPGEKRQTVLRVPVGGLANAGEVSPGGRRGDGYEMPVILINGARPGRTLLVTAGMHAGEFNGTPAAIRVARALEPSEMSGRAIFMPCVNTSGFWTMHPRMLPEDGYNLNAGYPGRPDGTVGERVADFFVREILPQADFILDLHGGSRGERMTPLAFFPTNPGAREASLKAAKALNLGCLVESQATKGQYSYAASALGIPGLLVERGEGYICDAELVEANRRDILLLLAHLGIIPETPGLRDEALKRRVFKEAVYVDSEWDGLWYPAVGKDQPIQKGQLLGTLQDLYGDSIGEVRARCDGHVLYVYTGLAAPRGEFLIAYGVADSEEK